MCQFGKEAGWNFFGTEFFHFLMQSLALLPMRAYRNGGKIRTYSPKVLELDLH
jgi:hypothetical protein